MSNRSITPDTVRRDLTAVEERVTRLEVLMKLIKKTHIAIFGNIQITRGWCKDCECTAFVIQKKLACCNSPFEPTPKFYKRECEPELLRRKPSAEAQRKIILLQDDTCCYCQRTFGTWVDVKRKPSLLRVEWDHMVPYTYSQNNQTENFVAACQFCNAWKSSMLFQTIESACVYLHSKWEEQMKSAAKMREKGNQDEESILPAPRLKSKQLGRRGL